MTFDAPSGFKKGDKVIVPKGTPLTSCHPQRKRWVSSRAQTVTVHHILETSKWVIGHRTVFVSQDGTHVDDFHFCQTESDLRRLCEDMGLPSNDVGIEALKQEALKHQHDPWGHGTSFDCTVQTSPERVCWPGTGGYWVDAPALACVRAA